MAESLPKVLRRFTRGILIKKHVQKQLKYDPKRSRFQQEVMWFGRASVAAASAIRHKSKSRVETRRKM